MITTQANRVPLLLAAFGALLLLATFFQQFDGVPESWRVGFGSSSESSEGRDGGAKASSHTASRPSFYEIALSHGTDKVTKHHYHLMYQKYLLPYRDKHLKMLEIGLGCDMSYGPGASFYTWLEYFPYVDLYFIEYDAACAEKWAANTTEATIFTGDQADVEFLNSFMEEAGTNFDIIIDDGGHRMNQQIISLETLWKAVVPGGIYFCEDLQTSYWEAYGGDPTNSGKKKTMIGMIKELVDDLHVGPGGHKRRHEVSVDMQSIDCMEEVCAFAKKQS